MEERSNKQSSIRAFKRGLSQNGKITFSKDMQLVKFIDNLNKKDKVLISNKVSAMLSPWSRKMIKAVNNSNLPVEKALQSIKSSYVDYETFIKVAELSYPLRRFKEFNYERRKTRKET